MPFGKAARDLYYSCFDLHRLEAKSQARRAALQHAGLEFPVVSMTSVPRRIAAIKPTLVSLLRQDVPPQRIRINLGKDLFGDTPLPGFLSGLKLVEVHWVPNDLGPATKYIPTLERYRGSNQLIVVLDDDMYYAKQLLRDLVGADRAANGQKVFCANGLKVPADRRSSSRPSDKALDRGSRRVAIVEGCGGYTLRPRFVGATDLKDLRGAPPRALFDDDIWLSGHLSRAKIEKVQIATGKRRSLMNTVHSAISGDRARLQTELMQHFTNDWAGEEIHPLG